MAFQVPEYQELLQRILNRARTDIDKREGSIFYDAVAPVSVELLVAYTQLQMYLDQVFLDTATGEYLTRRAAEYGVIRKPAVKAVRKATFNAPVAVGNRFEIDGLYYRVIKAGSNPEVECETPGTIGNEPVGEMSIIDHAQNLTTAILGDIVIPGSEEESDEELRERALQKMRQPAISGNKVQYELWAKEVQGVGDAKVFPLWNGRGTVKIVIVDTDYNPASPELVKNVQNHIDPNPAMGEGLAPIGAYVTVVSATPKTINVSATLKLEENKTLREVQPILEKNLTAYLKGIAFKENVVRIAQIGNAIISTPGVIDYQNLTINGGTSNITLTNEEIPQKGKVTLNV